MVKLKTNRLIYFICISILSIGQVFGQDELAPPLDGVKFTFGKEMKRSFNSGVYEIIALKDKNIYTMDLVRKGMLNYNVQVSKYGQDMQLANQVTLDFKKPKRQYVGKTFVGDELYFFTSIRNKETNKKKIVSQHLSTPDLFLNTELNELAEFDFKSNWTPGQNGGFQYLKSPDEKIIMAYTYDNQKVEEYEKMTLELYNSNLTSMWKKQITMPFKEDLFLIETMRIDNEGNYYILGKLYEPPAADAKKNVKRGKKFIYKLVAFTNQANKQIEYDIKLNEKVLTDVQLSFSKENSLICAGFYSDTWDKYRTGVNGTFFMKIDATSGAVISQNTKDFSFEFITSTYSESEQAKAKKKLDKRGKEPVMTRYVMRDLIKKDDGGAVLLAEKYYTYTTTTTSYVNGQPQTRTVYHYVYKDIMVVNVNDQGNITWAEKIPKYQHSTNDGGFYSSFGLAVVEDKMYFFFNDNAKNLGWKKGDPVYNFKRRGKNSVLTAVIIDAKGNVSDRKTVFSKKEAGTLTIPKMCKQTDKKEFVMYGVRFGKHRFIRLDFD